MPDPTARFVAILLAGVLLLPGCDQEPSEDKPSAEPSAESRQEVETTGGPGARIVVGFTPKSDFEVTAEAQVRPLEDDATYHVDVRILDARTGEMLQDVSSVKITITGPKDAQWSKNALDMRATFGHFCEGFLIEHRKAYQVTVSYQGGHAGAGVLTFYP